MKKIYGVLLLLAMACPALAQQDTSAAARKKAEDWANFLKMIEERVHKDWAWMKRYEGDNEKLAPPAANEKRVVFMGNSITEGWVSARPEFFKGKPYVGRGIGGQTTPQMLVRFRNDVINLKPAVVIILAGINDIAENTGPSTIETIFGNIVSMAELAKANKIRVVLSSVLPAHTISWNNKVNPVEKVAQLNALLKDYALKNNIPYADYYTAMVDERKGLPADLAQDGVHPTVKGYQVMEPIAEKAIAEALKRKQ
ncbi:acylhydrolase [Mucilaginibacter hurinus]|uniref:Acylhydrolase n=1 Tax=Mucilaginibacter hurinus TaxID=2201324 RepID=A0A367GL12_9SPHI|nr:SGNH/GDSL hydrolase family protein [Mucilaginibacter hurinus]RCH54167.1 acylhydrolase [Mucilaginibacter hurinus]